MISKCDSFCFSYNYIDKDGAIHWKTMNHCSKICLISSIAGVAGGIFLLINGIEHPVVSQFTYSAVIGLTSLGSIACLVPRAIKRNRECRKFDAAIHLENGILKSLKETKVMQLNETFLYRDVLIEIFKHLSQKDLCIVALTCKTWNLYSSSNEIWKKFIVIKFSKIETISNKSQEYKQHIISKIHIKNLKIKQRNLLNQHERKLL